MIELAIIPARAGSIGLPGKNISELGGHPLISWTVRAALRSGIFSRVIVTTDGEEIAEAARVAGAEIPFIRPQYLATSEANSIDVITHALDETGTKGAFALLQPTSPFRNAAHLSEAANSFVRSQASSVISVSRSKPLDWLFEMGREHRLVPLARNRFSSHRRQDATTVYSPNGAMYFCHCERFREAGTLYFSDTIGYPMSLIDGIDIDEREDLDLARGIVDQGLRVVD